jgi:hypothetical protein
VELRVIELGDAFECVGNQLCRLSEALEAAEPRDDVATPPVAV